MKKLIILAMLAITLPIASQKKVRVNGETYKVKEDVIKGSYTVKKNNKTVAKVKYDNNKKTYRVVKKD